MKRIDMRGRIALGIGFVTLISGLLIYRDVHGYESLICTSIAAAPNAPVAIVFGAQGAILTDRVLTGVELYKAGKVKKLLMTGDNNRNDYNEPAQMQAQALILGVPARDIVCDYAGFRTFDSLYRARDIFGVHHAILVTQRYHLPRALFIARHLGIDVVGVDAAKRTYVGQRMFNAREVVAIETAWFDVNVTHRRPKFLGKPEPI